MNTVEILERRALERAGAPAIIDANGRTTTFAQLVEASAKGAALLRCCGVDVGDRVVLMLPISTPLYVALLSVLRAGAVATVFDPSAGRKHIRRCCGRATPKAMIASPKAHLLRLASSAIRAIPLKFNWGGRLPGAISFQDSEELGPLAPQEVEPEAPALLTFTSGSTGEPKAAVRSHRLLAAQGEAVRAAMKLAPGETSLTTLPVFTLANLAAGVTTLLADADLARPGHIDALLVLRQLERYRPASGVASPAFFERLAAHGGPERKALGALSRIYTGGAPVYPDLMRRLKEAAPRAEVVAVYGSTEAEPIAHVEWAQMSAEDLERMSRGEGLLAGSTVAEVSLRILPNRFGAPIERMSGEAFQAACLGPGKAGEIVVSGEHVLKGYLDGVGDETTKFKVDGATWHRTGDVGKLDGRGRLWLLGRAQAVIRDAKGELFPFAVEVAAREVPGVVRSALVSQDGRRVLVVEGEGPDLERALMAHLAWARLDAILRVGAIPLDGRHNAKVDYPALRKMIERFK